MASIKPEQSFIILTLSGVSSTLFCESIQYEPYSTPFTRVEFTHQKQDSALESAGVEPQLVTLIYGVRGQITSTGAVPTTARNLLPDDADLNNIYQKRFGIRYTLVGTTTRNADVSLVEPWFQDHLAREMEFEAHQNFAGGNISIQEIEVLKLDNFSYLTSTGLQFSSSSIGIVDNVLIRDFSIGVDYQITNNDGSFKVLNDWRLVLETTNFGAQNS